MKVAPFLLALAMVVPAIGGTPWSRLPQDQIMPVNMASNALEGVGIHASDRIAEPENLLSEDATVGTALPAGRSEIVVKLAAQQVVEMTRFMNDGTEGRVIILGSTDAGEWAILGRATFGTGTRTVETRFGGAQGRFVKLVFDLARAGTIRTFKLYGRSDHTGWEVVKGGRDREEDADQEHDSHRPFCGLNWAGGFDEARPIYVHPTPKHLEMGHYTENLYEFPVTTESCRTVVYDLGRVRAIRHFSTAYSRTPARVEVFVFTNLPEKTDWRDKTTLDPDVFDLVDPVAEGMDSIGIGHMKHVPEGGITGRYIAVRYHPFTTARTAGLRSRPMPGLAGKSEWKSLLGDLLPVRGFVSAVLDHGFVPAGPRFVATATPKPGEEKSDSEEETDEEGEDTSGSGASGAGAGNTAPGGEFEATIEIADESSRAALRADGGSASGAGADATTSFPAFGIFSMTSASAGGGLRPFPGASAARTTSRPRKIPPIVIPPSQTASP